MNFEEQLDAELRFDYEQRVANKMRSGMSEAEAYRATRLEFGGLEQVKEQCRDARGLQFLHSLLQDIRYAARGMQRSPGFTAVAVAMLAIGIGVNAAVFSVTNAVVFKGFPLVQRNDRILYMTTGRGCCVSWADFKDWRAQAKSFEGMELVHGTAMSISDQSSFPARHDATEVTAGTFQLAGVKPILGRDFAPSDDKPGAAPVVILRYSFWENRYGKDPAIIGRTVRMNGVPTTVIGVMPRGFSFPQNQDLWVPFIPTGDILKREKRDTWFVFGRMRDGVAIESARSEMETIGRRLGSAYPLTNQGQNLLPHVETFQGFFVGPNSTLIYEATLGAVGFVLLIACANLANLLLARAIGRSREISVRVALGAGRRRIVRQLFLESMMLAGAGGFFGWWIAKWSMRIYALAPNGSGISDQIFGGTWFDNVLDYSMDYRVLAYLIAISIGTGILFGLAPAFRLSRLDVNAALKDGDRGSTGGGSHLSAMLVTVEMALAVVLLAGAGLMIRSFLNTYNSPLGVRTNNILTALISLPSVRYPREQAQASFYDRLITGLEAIPGLKSVAICSQIPGRPAGLLPYELEGAPRDEKNRPTATALVISKAYFETLHAPVLAGRPFNDGDGRSGLPVAIVNEQFASHHWPGESSVGKRFRLFPGKTAGPWLTVIGVARNIAQNGASRQEFDPVVYVPFRQRPSGDMWIVARTNVAPGALAGSIRRELQALDPEMPVAQGPGAMEERLAGSYQYRGVIAGLFLIFAAIALLLAAIGLYAIMAHTVSRRRQEIGIRMALGAAAGNILRLVLRQGMLPVSLGLGIGLAASFGVNRLLRSALVQVSPYDPVTLAVASGTLILAAILGCLTPARRAMRVDPAVALRHE